MKKNKVKSRWDDWGLLPSGAKLAEELFPFIQAWVNKHSTPETLEGLEYVIKAVAGEVTTPLKVKYWNDKRIKAQGNG